MLHQTVSAIRPETWEAVNRAVLVSAQQDKLESGATVRIDSTVTAALMHEPSDSALLWDAVRVMTRLLRQAAGLPGAPALQWRDRRRLAKKRARAIEYSRGKAKRRRLYRELIAATRATQAALYEASKRLADLAGTAAQRWRAQFDHYRPLIERILAQSQRRVLDGQVVPASEKLVSLFEPHADIIVKGNRDVQYGHKLNLVTGRSGLILDVVVETGNPADAERFVPMLERQIARCGAPPRQVAADGGYASHDNLTAAKARGVKDVAFHKRRGLALEDMVKSRWVYRKLRNFRAGIEAGISCLKRAYGLALHLARARPLQDLHLVRGGRAQPGAARSSQTGIAAAQTGSFGDGRRKQTSLSTLARQTILSAAAAIQREKRRAPANNRPTLCANKPLKMCVYGCALV